MTEPAKQCSVLVIDPGDTQCRYRAMLESLGFRVTETREWPQDDGALLDHHVVIVQIRTMGEAPMVAARLRARPRFGHRVLIALVPASASLQDRRCARASGFDEALIDTGDGRLLSARILKRLRSRPEHHCLLPPAHNRRPAA